ncbi:MAG: alpha/beta fold hydrolase [Gammaproteobacteria bacterium]
MEQALLEAVTVGAADAQYSVIWLHGLGADGHDFEPIVPELPFRQKPQTRFIFPHAPIRPVSLNMGYQMPAWFDIYAIDARARQDEAGIREAADRIAGLVEQEHRRGVAYEHIVLAGFSQGGALALYLGLRFPQRLAGILAMSTYLPLADKLATEIASANAHTPIFMAHGEYDPVVPLSLGQLSMQQLQQQGCAIQWRVYPMEHTVIPEELNDIGRWLDNALA